MSMGFTIEPAVTQEIQPLREQYRQEMNCQIVHDSLHARPGWTASYLIQSGGRAVGYGSIAKGGPWTESPAVFEFFLLPGCRLEAFEIFHAFLSKCRATRMEVQSNDELMTVMLHALAHDVTSEKILFRDHQTTTLARPGAEFRKTEPGDNGMFESLGFDARADWVLDFDGRLAGAGGVLYHYNPPYGDVFMAIAEPFRRRGLGSLLVQELKRVCREGGHVPAARCQIENVASRRTLQRAGFVPCGHILTGRLCPA